MESHKELPLAALRMYIIRYGAKYMEAFESDLYNDCKKVGKIKEGETLYWMVSGTHTYLLNREDIRCRGLKSVIGDRFNYKITCSLRGKIDPEKQYDLIRLTKADLLRELKMEEGQ